MSSDASRTPALHAFPMHGQHKLTKEGYRTRDGHFIEWLGRLNFERGVVSVISRPEPALLSAVYRRSRRTIADNTRAVWTSSHRIPKRTDRQDWWVRSLNDYPAYAIAKGVPSISWNPFIGSTNISSLLNTNGAPFIFDLLDDWTFHYAFSALRKDVDLAYRRTFDLASHVTANSEATQQLAFRYGRTDAILVPNGCDPERFSQESRAVGPLTIGYVGKIGKRIDLDLVLRAARAAPDAQFVFAGPILDNEYRRPLTAAPNIQLLGDVHYEDVPSLLQRFDLGWVPHRVGEGEVGGDVIKTYEYRAAALPVLTTPVLGADSRGLTEVTVLPARDQVAYLSALAGTTHRIARRVGPIPVEATWKRKAKLLQSMLY